MLSFTDFLDDSILLGLSLKASECIFKRFIFFNTNLTHYIPSLRIVAGVLHIFVNYTLTDRYMSSLFFTISKLFVLF